MSCPSPAASPLRYARSFEGAERMGLVYETALRWLQEAAPCYRRRMEILDVGCNTGYMGRVISQKLACAIDGVEGEEEAASEAAKIYRRVLRINLDDTDLAREAAATYDCILALDVVEHLREPSRALRAFRKILRNNGRLVVSVPNVANWRIRLALLRGEFEYAEMGILDRTHLRFYTRGSFHRELSQSGFAVVEENYTYDGIPLRRFLNRRTKKFLARLWPEALAYQFVALARPLAREEEKGGDSYAS